MCYQAIIEQFKLSDMDDHGKESLRVTPEKIDQSSLAGRMCKIQGASSGELRSGCGRQKIVRVPAGIVLDSR